MEMVTVFYVSGPWMFVICLIEVDQGRKTGKFDVYIDEQ